MEVAVIVPQTPSTLSADQIAYVPLMGQVPRKRPLTQIERSLYWLENGKDPNKLYQPLQQHPFGEVLTDAVTQRMYAQGVETALYVYIGRLRREVVERNGVESMQIRSNYRGRRGNPAVVITATPEGQEILHTWVKPSSQSTQLM